MYLLYLDASGTPEPQDASKHFVLVGLALPEGSWFGLDQRIRILKERYNLPGRDPDLLPIHVKQFAVDLPEQKAVPGFDQLSRADRRVAVLEVRRRKLAAETTNEGKETRRGRYADTDPFLHLTRSERSQLLEDAVDLIAGHDRVRLFGEVVSKSHPTVVAGKADVVREAFTQVVSRFDQFLVGKDAWKLRPGRPLRVDHGLLVLDQGDRTEAVYERLFREFRRDGFPFGRMNRVIDVPFFAADEKVGGLQLADVAAYVVRRYVDRGAVVGSHEERQFRKLFPKFDRGTTGKLHGLRHYVPAGSCACMICVERGHAPPDPPPPG